MARHSYYAFKDVFKEFCKFHKIDSLENEEYIHCTKMMTTVKHYFHIAFVEEQPGVIR